MSVHRKTDRTLRWIVFIGGAAVLFWLTTGLSRLGLIVLWGLVTLEAWNKRRIPVLAYHSISNQGEWIGDPSLVTPIRSFDAQMKWLKRLDYDTLFLDELFDLRTSGKKPSRIIVLTFDDGYLDNWVGAFGVLKKYGLKGTIFVPTSFIDPGEVLRPTLPEAASDQLEWRGYLNRTELITLQQSGLVDVQSHALSHDYVFSSDELDDFVSPTNHPIWLYLLLYPENKPDWFKKDASPPLAYPIFTKTNALAGAAFIPDQGLVDRLHEQGAEPGFFDDPQWKDQLRKIVDLWRNEQGRLGEMETREQTLIRWTRELDRSRRELENIMDKPVKHLCWPRNALCRESEKMALDNRYLSTTSVQGHYNGPDAPHRVERLFPVATGWPIIDVTRMLLEIWVFKGHYLGWPLLFLLQRTTRTLVKKRLRSENQ